MVKLLLLGQKRVFAENKFQYLFWYFSTCTCTWYRYIVICTGMLLLRRVVHIQVGLSVPGTGMLLLRRNDTS
jgi:hypothetical protein